ncbi:MAG: acyl-[acyl-carrier-protein]--UDP-N-acetylglucosamine O-acyltransferase [Candidatus Omnitrophica bacterium CG07_land_8_20_14_0_80_42_15]|uniref:Acyl-[acyl-carrier-protein]--UDP-N-acetylglucosamine O-acyltransferase n=1 Tax=Candidatus Aquitaenariimonas noxiae TaxID=1974741 RepID=A0A2J0L4N8_9BACT|nr:MAG: acyl-[acyl-carrier-protein]--UDP-N-acetylglucosamine O-acyltransferase [Candidatus Omnitrophica bacterium CG07_land_8_20_14_0_80_42_15]
MKIHPTAIVHKNAKLADDVEVGPYSIIEENASIDSGTIVGNHCFIGSFTTIGKNNRIFTGAVVGSISQDLKFKGDESFLQIGDENLIREYVTMNRSSEKGKKTVVGNNNLFMAYAHIGHDSVIGNGTIIANCGTLGGYVTIENKAIMGGLSGAHQFTKIGRLAIIGGCSKVVQDIPPYCMADGHPAAVRGINLVGLRRAEFPSAKIEAIRKAIKLLFFSKLTIKSAVEKIISDIPPSLEINNIIDFIKSSKRGLSK